MKTEGVRCSVIGLAAELHVSKHLASATGGDHGVVMDDKHYKDLLSVHVDPPAAATRLDSALVKMGFPHHALHATSDTPMTMCMWQVFQNIKQFILTNGNVFKLTKSCLHILVTSRAPRKTVSLLPQDICVLNVWANTVNYRSNVEPVDWPWCPRHISHVLITICFRLRITRRFRSKGLLQYAMGVGR